MTASSRYPKKSHLPAAAWAIQRRALRARLSAALDYKVTLVSAPPGYGKSTAVAEFAHSTNAPVVWHALETRERDVLNLHLHFLDAITQVFPSIDRSAYPVGQSTEELAREATDLLRRHAQGQFIYVLDDCQFLTGYDNAELWLSLFVEHLPKNAHLILISRGTPRLPYMQMTAHKEILPVSLDHLRFSKDELEELAQQLGADADAIQRMESLLDTLEGWPAGTVLALQPLPQELQKVLPTPGSGPEALFESLAASMLAGQAPELRNFLLASSTFTRMTPELCNQVLGYADSSELFDQVAKKNLFLSRASGGMTYHKLFRIFLQRRLYNDNPGLFASYHLQAGVWFEQSRNLEEAFDHFISADAADRARSIAERMADITFKQGRYETLLRWNRKLSAFTETMPWLRYATAMIHIDRLDYEPAIVELEQAARDFRSAKNDAALAKVYFQRAQIDLREGRVVVSIQIAQQLAQSGIEEDNLQGRAQHLLGLASLRKGDVQAAAEYLESAVPLFREHGEGYALSVVLQDLHLAYVRLGRTDAATTTLHEVVALRRGLQSPGPLATALNLLGWHFHRHRMYQEAWTTLQEGLDVLAGSINPRAEGYVLWSLADLLRDCRQFNEAEARYVRALEVIADSEPVLRCAILINYAIMRRWQQNPRAACQLAEEALHLAEKIEAGPEQHLAEAVLRAAEVDLGEDPELALKDIRAAADFLQEKNGLIDLVYVLALCADVEALAGNQAGARQGLRDALRAASAGGGRQPLLAEALNNPRFNDLVEGQGAQMKDFIAARDTLASTTLSPIREGPPVDGSPPTTYSLRIYALGKEEFERNGKPVPSSTWKAANARQIFLHLLFRGAQTREQIALYFWPDHTPEDVRNNFQTCVHRARGALGRDALIHENNFYMVSPDIDIWCDVFEIERLAQQARLQSTNTPYAEDLWHAIVDLYQGTFLPSMDADWISIRRDQLQRIYLEALVSLGSCLRLRDAIPEAIATIEEALVIDLYLEEAHREIMRCYAQNGEIARVVAQYRHLEDLLRDDLNAAPSPETTRLMQELTRDL